MADTQGIQVQRRAPLPRKRLTAATPTTAPVLCLIRTGGATGSQFVGSVLTTLGATLAEIREVVVSLATGAQRGDSGPMELHQRRLIETPPVNVSAEHLSSILEARLHPFDLCGPFTFVRSGGCVPLPRSNEGHMRLCEVIPTVAAFGPPGGPGWSFKPAAPLVVVARTPPTPEAPPATAAGASEVPGTRLREAIVVLFVSQGDSASGGLHTERVVMERLVMQQETYGRPFRVKPLMSLITKWNASTPDYLGRTVLMESVLAGSETAVKYLLSLSFVRINAVDWRGNTALHYAVSTRDATLVSALLKAGADVLRSNANGETPLHTALLLRNDMCVDLLCRQLCAKGIPSEKLRDYVDSTGLTPLDVFRLYSPTFRQLVDEGDLDALRALHRHFLFDRSVVPARDALLRQTALHAASERGHLGVVVYILDELQLPKMMGRIRHRGMLDSRNQTPLHLAAKRGHLPVVKLIMQRYPEQLKLQDINGRTPLLGALYSAKIEVALYMAGAAEPGGVAPEVLDRCGYGALHYACVLQQHGLVQLLVDRHSASVNSRITAQLSTKEMTPKSIPSPTSEPEEYLRQSRRVKGRYATLRQRKKPKRPLSSTVETQYDGPTPLWCAVRVAGMKGRRWYDIEAARIGVCDQHVNTAPPPTAPCALAKANAARRRLVQRLPPVIHQSSVDLINFLLDSGAGSSCSSVEVQEMLRDLLLVNNTYVADQLVGLADEKVERSNTLLCALCEHEVPIAIRWCVERKLGALNSTEGGCPLYVSARVGDVETVRYLLSQGALPDVILPILSPLSARGSETPLLAAIRCRHISVVEELLRAGARPVNPNANAGSMAAPLTLAAVEGVEPVVRGLVGLGSITTLDAVHALTSVLQRVWILSEGHRAICVALARKIAPDESPVHPTELLHLAASKGLFDVVTIIAEKVLNLPSKTLGEMMAASPPAPQRTYSIITPTVTPVAPKIKRLLRGRAGVRRGLYRVPKEIRRLMLPPRHNYSEWRHRLQLRDVFSYCTEAKQYHVVLMLVQRLRMTPWRGADLRGWNAMDYALENNQYDIARLLAACGMTPHASHDIKGTTALAVLNRALPGSFQQASTATMSSARQVPWPEGEAGAALCAVVEGIVRSSVFGTGEGLRHLTASCLTCTPISVSYRDSFGVATSVTVFQALLRDICKRHEVRDLSCGGDWVDAALLACVEERRVDLLRVLVEEFNVSPSSPIRSSSAQLLPTAAVNRDSAMVTYLLHHGAPPHVPGAIPLYLSSSLPDAKLSPKGTPVRRTALYIAALLNDAAMTESLAFSAPLDADMCTNAADIMRDALGALITGAPSCASEEQQQRLAKVVGVLAHAGHLYTSPSILRRAAQKRLHHVVAALVANYGQQTILADLKSDQLGALHYMVMDSRNEELLRELLTDNSVREEGTTVGRAHVTNAVCRALSQMRLNATVSRSPVVEALRHGCAGNAILLVAAGVPCEVEPKAIIAPVNAAVFCAAVVGSGRSSAALHRAKVGKVIDSHKDYVACHQIAQALRLRTQRQAQLKATGVTGTTAEEVGPYSVLHAVAELNYIDVFRRLERDISLIRPSLFIEISQSVRVASVISMALRHADGVIARLVLEKGLVWGAISSRTVFEMLCCRVVARALAQSPHALGSGGVRHTAKGTSLDVDVASLLLRAKCNLTSGFIDTPFDVFELAKQNYNVWAVIQALRRNFMLARSDTYICTLTGVTSAIVLNNLEAVQDLVLSGVCSLTGSSAEVSPTFTTVASKNGSYRGKGNGRAADGAQKATHPSLDKSKRVVVSPLVLSIAILASTPTPRLPGDATIRIVGPRTRADLVSSMRSGSRSITTLLGDGSVRASVFTSAATRSAGSTYMFNYSEYGTQFDTQVRISMFLLSSGALTPELINPLAIMAARLRQWTLLEAIVDAALALRGTVEGSRLPERFFVPVLDSGIPSVLACHIGTARHVMHAAAALAPKEVLILVARYSNRRDVESTADARGRTAMYHAIRHPHPSAVDTLLSLRVPITAPCCFQTGRTPLMVAAMHGNAHALSALLKRGAPVNVADVKGNTALTLACTAGHIPIVEMLLLAEASTSVVSTSGLTPVMAAALYGHDAVALPLSQHFCSATDLRTSTTSLLHCAAIGGCGRTTESVLHMWERASVLDDDVEGHSPLFLAYAFGNAHVLRLLVTALVKHGIQPTNAVDVEILACSSMLHRYGWLRGVLKVGEALDNEARTRYLSSRFAIRPGEQLYLPYTKPLRSERSRLLWCSRYNHPVGVRVLADLNVADDVYALHAAAARGHVDVVQLLVLLEMSDPNIRNGRGDVAFECAAQNGFAECASFLLQRMTISPQVLHLLPPKPVPSSGTTLQGLPSSDAHYRNTFHILASSKCSELLPELVRRVLLIPEEHGESDQCSTSTPLAEVVLTALEAADGTGHTPFECAVATGSSAAVLRVAQALRVVGHAAKKDAVLSISNAFLHSLPSMAPTVRAVLRDFFGVREVETAVGFQAYGAFPSSVALAAPSAPRLSFADVRLLGINRLLKDPFCAPKIDMIYTLEHEKTVMEESIAPGLPFKAHFHAGTLASLPPSEQVRMLQRLGTSLLAADIAPESVERARVDTIEFHIVPHRADTFISVNPERKGVLQVGVHAGTDSLTVPDVNIWLREATGAEEVGLLRRVGRACKHIARKLRKLPHPALKAAKIDVNWDGPEGGGRQLLLSSDGATVGYRKPTVRTGSKAPCKALECLLDRGLPQLLYEAEVSMPDILAGLSAQELRAVFAGRDQIADGVAPVPFQVTFQYMPTLKVPESSAQRAAMVVGSMVAPALAATANGGGGGDGGAIGSVVIGFRDGGVDTVQEAVAAQRKALQRDANLVHIHHIRDHFVKHVFSTCGKKMGGELLKFKLELEGGGIDQIPLHLFEESLRNVADALAGILMDTSPEMDGKPFRLDDLRSSTIVANSVAKGVRAVQVLFSTRRAPIVKRSGGKLLFSFTPQLIPTRSEMYEALREHTVELEIERIKEVLPALVTDMGQRLNTLLPSTSLVVDTASLVEDDDDENVLASLALLSHNHGALVFQALIEGVGVGWDTELGGIIRKATRQVTITLERGAVGSVVVLPGGHIVYYCPLHCVQRGLYRQSTWCLLTAQQISSLIIIQFTLEHPEISRLVHKSMAFACWTRVHGRGSRVVTAGARKCRFLVETRSILNLPVRNGGETLQFSCVAIKSFKVVGRSDGRYEVRFKAPLRSGKYTIDATLHSMPLFNSPIALRVLPLAAELKQTIADIDFTTVVAKVPFTFSLRFFDRFGNAAKKPVPQLCVEGPAEGNEEGVRVRSWRQIRADMVDITVVIEKSKPVCLIPIRLSVASDSHTVPVRVECISRRLYGQICALRSGHPTDVLQPNLRTDGTTYFFRRAYRQAARARWQREATAVGGVFTRSFPKSVRMWWRDRRQRQRKRALRQAKAVPKAQAVPRAKKRTVKTTIRKQALAGPMASKAGVASIDAANRRTSSAGD